MVTLPRKCSYCYRVPGFDSQAFPPFRKLGEKMAQEIERKFLVKGDINDEHR